MFIKYEKVKRKNGVIRTYATVVESYWDTDGKPKHRRIKSYGYIEKQADPALFIKQIEAELTLLKEQYERDIEIKVSREENIFDGENNCVKNIGYIFLNEIYDKLNLDTYFNALQKEKNIRYKIKDIFKFLVLQRIMNPDSKRASVMQLDSFFGKSFDFSLDDVYRCLTLLAPEFDGLQDYMKAQSDHIVKRDYSKIYYDCTNYYCEIDYNDTIENLRHRGVSKEHRVDPIVGLGLFLDNSGLPIKCQVFNGNVAESTTLIPGIKALKKEKNLGRIIMVADKGLNTSKNIEELVKNGDGYVFSQILRGKKGKRFHGHILSDEGYTKRLDQYGNVEYKYKTLEEEYCRTNKDGAELSAKRKVLIYYSLKDDIAAKRKRAEKIAKAEVSLTNNAYGIKHGYDQYLKESLIDSDTGEVLNGKVVSDKAIDTEKVGNDELFDGYFCIITSELNYDEKQIRETYGSLWEIEQAFRVTKTDLEFRPIYHFKKENIQSHFLICFCALLVLRLLQQDLKRNSLMLSPECIVEALNNMSAQNIKGTVQLLKPAALEVITNIKLLAKIKNFPLDKAFVKLEIFRNRLKPFLHNTSVH